MRYFGLFIAISFSLGIAAQDDSQFVGPKEYVFDSTKTIPLKAFVFFPAGQELAKTNPAIVIFHGGGWSIGEPSWAFGLCEKYAKKGMVAVAAQYRLSDEKTITPVDAMEDARDIILWMRENSVELKIKKDQIAAYGWSAGAHLAACAAIFPTSVHDKKINSVPNALVLISPALSMKNDGWFKKLLGEDENPLKYSPAEHVKKGVPPSIIVVGKDDTVTPIVQSKLYHNNMLKAGNESYLYIYDGVGHLFTPSDQPDNGWPNPDKEVQTKAYMEIDSFLMKLGYLK